jgi:hypothetical protein
MYIIKLAWVFFILAAFLLVKGESAAFLLSTTFTRVFWLVAFVSAGVADYREYRKELK